MTNQLSKKKIYIAGAGGMLGEAFYTVYKNDFELKCTDKDVNDNWLSFLDFRDFNSYQDDVFDFSPDYLFHLGAYTDLEYCEKNIEDTYATNTVSVKYAVTLANQLKIPLLYISTAGIFDGKKDLYVDTDQPNPLGHYANSKYLGEKYVMENSLKYLICRAGWMMGGGFKKDKKFINKLIKQIQSGITELNVVDDRDGTPTYTIDFAKNVKALLEKEHWGLYNMVCNGQTSRYEVAEELLNLMELNTEVKLNKVSSDYFKDIYFAPRPPSERLINKNLDKLGLNLMRDWRIALKDYLQTYYEECLRLTIKADLLIK